MEKDKYKIIVGLLVVILITMVLLIVGRFLILENKEMSQYLNDTEGFVRVEVNELKEMISSGSEFILYIGRATCPWCRAFVKDLKFISWEDELTIYYLDSENTGVDNELAEFRELYNIEYVPSMIYFSDTIAKALDIDVTSQNYSKYVLKARLEETKR
ncbi:MAG: hypothetical protein ACK5LT_00615 [Lachnospirales bacterium]